MKNKYSLYFSALIHNRGECWNGMLDFFRFAFFKIPANCILLAEPNSFHGECLPGFAKYFNDLGYQVIIFCRYSNWKDNSFCRFPVQPAKFCLTIWGMRFWLRSKKMKCFEYILLTSSYFYSEEYKFFWRYTDFLRVEPKGKLGFGLIEHNLSEDSYGDFWKSQLADSPIRKVLQEHTFVLTEMVFQNIKIPMLNPHYFGAIHSKNCFSGDKRIFVTIGKITSSSRNFSKLLETLEKLDSSEAYEIWVIGSGNIENIPEQVRFHIRILGHLSFCSMYEKMEQADFFLPLLEPESQSIYLHGCTSGSRQLILGFKIIPVMQKHFAEHYGFSEKNAILYEDNLKDAFEKALHLPLNTYIAMRNGLRLEKDRVRNSSLENLKYALKKGKESIS